MPIKVAINGYGRIGSNILRALFEDDDHSQIKLVAINTLTQTPEALAHLTRYDSVHGRFKGDIEAEQDCIRINDRRIKVMNEADPSQLPWGELDVDVVLECSGAFTKRDKASAHLQAGAKQVLISAPSPDADATIVYGVNHHQLTRDQRVVSNASCTTNCLAPLAYCLHRQVGIESGLMNTVHAFTNDQNLNDGSHKDIRRARSATRSIIPTKTGAAAAVGLVIPELEGRLDGFAMRVPTNNVSIVDLTFVAGRNTSVEEINQLLQQASEHDMASVMAYSDELLVSCDYNHHPASCVIDSSLTRVSQGNLVKVCAWYDNEWGFSKRMLDTSQAMCNHR